MRHWKSAGNIARVVSPRVLVPRVGGNAALGLPAAPARGMMKKPPKMKHKRKAKPVYTPIVIEKVLPKGHPLLTTKVLPHDPKHEHLFVLHAKSRTRDETGKYVAADIRKEGNMTAIITTNEFDDQAKNEEKSVRCTIPVQAWKKIEAENRIYNSVFSIFIDDNPEPIKVLTSHYQVECDTDKPLNVVFLRFFPGKRIKIGIPTVYENYSDSSTLRKGGMLRDMMLPWGWPCWWAGDEKIPSAICIDLLNTRVGWNYKFMPEMCPPGLTIRKPHTSPHHVLATIQGKIRRGEDADEDED